MRRAVAVIAATSGGLALLANFHTTPASTGVVEEPSTSGSPTSTTATTTTPPPTTPSTRVVTTAATSTTTTTTTTAPVSGERVDGPVAHNEWGDVQVRVVLSDGTITDVQALKLPDSNSHSVALSRAVQRKLREEALQAQSAEIDLVSGATLTSENYIQSLQGALDSAGR